MHSTQLSSSLLLPKIKAKLKYGGCSEIVFKPIEQQWVGVVAIDFYVIIFFLYYFVFFANLSTQKNN